MSEQLFSGVWSPTGAQFACCSSSGDLLLWEMTQYWSERYWASVNAASGFRTPSRRLSLSSNALYEIAQLQDNVLAVVGVDGLWLVSWDDFSTFQQRFAAMPTQRSFNCAAYVAQWGLLVGCDNGDVLQGKIPMQQQQQRQLELLPRFRVSGGAAVLSIVASPDGSIVFIGSADGMVRCWQPASNSELWCLDVSTGKFSEPKSGQSVVAPTSTAGDERVLVRSLAVSASGNWLFVGSSAGFVGIWHIQSRSLAGTIPVSSAPLALRLTSDGELLVGACDERVHRWSVSGEHRGTHSTSLRCVWDVAELPKRDNSGEVAALAYVGVTGVEIATNAATTSFSLQV